MTEYPFSGLTPDRLNNNSKEMIKFPLKVKWKAPIGHIMGDPVIGQGRIVIPVYSTLAFDYGAIITLDQDTGERLWETTPDGAKSIPRRICLYHKMIYVGLGESLAALSIEDGHIIWRKKPHIVLERGMWTATDNAIIYEDKLYIDWLDGIAAFDPITGEIIWFNEVAKRPSQISFSGNKMVFGVNRKLSGGSLYCLESDTGRLIWEHDLTGYGETNKNGEFEPGLLGSSHLVIFENKIVSSIGRYVACFDLNTGNLLWKTQSYTAEFTCTDNLVAGFGHASFEIFDFNTGERKFENRKFESHVYYSSPLLIGDVFLVGNLGALLAFDIHTGEIIWSIKNKKKHGGFVSQPIYLDGRLYVGNSASKEFFYCYESR